MAMLRPAGIGGNNPNEEFAPPASRRRPPLGGVPPGQAEVPEQPTINLGAGAENSEIGEGGRGGESPRERQQGGQAGGNATKTQPMEPSPISAQTPMQVTQPLASPSPQALTSTLRGAGGMFGGQGGLTGGGLGMPFDPTSNQDSDPINTLMKLLSQGGGGF